MQWVGIWNTLSLVSNWTELCNVISLLMWQADQASLDISFSYFLDPMDSERVLTEYYWYIRDMVYVYLRHLNYSIQSAAELADEIADKILDFSTKLVSVSITLNCKVSCQWVLIHIQGVWKFLLQTSRACRGD